MDDTGSCTDNDYISDYFSNLSLLYSGQVRDRLSFFFLYEEICNSAFDTPPHYPDVLLSKANNKNRVEFLSVILQYV